MLSFRPTNGHAWKREKGFDGPLTGYVAGTYRYALLDPSGGLSVATEAALGGHYVDPSGTGERTPDGRWCWAVVCHLAVVRSGFAWDSHGAIPPLDLPAWAERPLLRPGVATTPDVVAWLQRTFPDRRVRPLARWWQAVPDPFRNLRRSVPLCLDTHLSPEEWLQGDWRDAHSGEDLTPTTNYAPPAGTVRVQTVRDGLHIWRLPGDTTTEPARLTGSILQPGLRRTRPVHSRPDLVQLVGKQGDDLLASLIDPSAATGQELTVYHQPDAWALTLEKACRFGARELMKRTGLSQSTIYRLLAGETPSPVTASVVADSITFEEPPESEDCWRTCARPGCGLVVRTPRRWCSPGCKKAVQRARDALALHAVGGKRCRYCGAARFGDHRAPCPVCEGQRPIQVPAVVCHDCGVERVGDTTEPCPFCKSQEAGW
jgi:hypothetical protein